MIIKRSKSGNKAREDLILPRLLKALRNRKVEVILKNGTLIEGVVKTYGKEVRTLQLPSAIRQLYLANQRFGDLHTFLNSSNTRGDCCNSGNSSENKGTDAGANSKNGDFKLNEVLNGYKWDGIREDVVSDSKSFVILKNSRVETGGTTYTFSDLSLRESNIAMLSVLTQNSDNLCDTRDTDGPLKGEEGGEKESSSRSDRERMVDRILSRIVNDHGRELKNKAFLKCSRIGSNNTKPNVIY